MPNLTNKEAINIHLRTYRSALRSSKEISIASLIPTYLKMNPLLHPKANSKESDQEALSYVLARLPKEISQTKLIIIGQTKEIFTKAGYKIKNWKQVFAPRRWRRTFFDPQTKTLASFIASISDVDDIINLLIALQIELNKTGQSPNFKVKLLSESWVNFAKNIQIWWREIIRRTKRQFNFAQQPLVFISSNSHSLINLLDGFCLKNKEKIISSSGQKSTNVYFASQFAFQRNPDLWRKKLAAEKEMGIMRIKPSGGFNLETQIIPGKLISPKLKNLIALNVEAPLGFAAFHLLEEVLENVQEIKGIYIMGKAAALNTKKGDILIPKIVFDEHTQNTYLVNNCFNNNFNYPFKGGSVLDNQKLVSVLGTFLQNKDLFDSYSEKEFNIIEMEAGPYLGAITQATFPKPLPQNTIVDLHQPPFEMGIIYYSSDNPYTLNETLKEALGPAGIEATYLTTQAIIDRVKKTD